MYLEIDKNELKFDRVKERVDNEGVPVPTGDALHRLIMEGIRVLHCYDSY